MSATCACLQASEVQNGHCSIAPDTLVAYMRERLSCDERQAREAFNSARCWLTDERLDDAAICLVAIPGCGCVMINEPHLARAMSKFEGTPVDQIEHSRHKGAVNRLLRSLVTA